MKLERISENEVHCILESKDLQQRNIQPSELSYGSEKAKSLFQEMLRQIDYEFDFDTRNIPLMLETVPMKNGSVILIITRVEETDELDTRFAHFAPNQLELLEYDDDEDDWEEDDLEEDDWSEDNPDEYKDIYPPELSRNGSVISLDLSEPNLEKQIQRLAANFDALSDTAPQKTNQTKVFSFSNLDDVSLAAHAIAHCYSKDSTLYHDLTRERYYLSLQSSSSHHLDMLSIQMNEYGCLSENTPSEAYCREHLQILIPNHAVQELSKM